MGKRRVIGTAGMALLLALAGCYESQDATNYDPGVYKGQPDPLLAKPQRSEQQRALEQRFRPWVAGPDQLEEERSRPPGQDKALRERALRVQGAY